MSGNRLAGVGLRDRSPLEWSSLISECVPPRVQSDVYAIVWWDWGIDGNEDWSNFRYDFVRNAGREDWTVSREELIEGLELAGYANPSKRVLINDDRSAAFLAATARNPSKEVDRRDWK